MALAFIFPGQGSQSVGMGTALSEAFPSAKAVFQEVDDALGQNLSKLMANGPIEDITLTENRQLPFQPVVRYIGSLQLDLDPFLCPPEGDYVTVNYSA